jgi:hypothetical protein
MVIKNIVEKIGNHIFAAQVAFGVVAFGLIIYMPSGIHYIDLSNSEKRAFIAGVTNDQWWSFWNWEYTTNIQEIDGVVEKHYWFGFPQMVAVDPGVHTINIYCGWRRFSKTLGKAINKMELDVLPKTLYLIESTYIDKGSIFNNECSVNIVKVTGNEINKLSKYQLEILKNYNYKPSA